MSRPRPHFRRPDLIYRAMLRDEQDTSPHDQLFDEITRKVMEHMDETPISTWDNNVWQAYKTMLTTHSKQPLIQSSGSQQLDELTEDELLQTALSRPTNSGDR